METTINDILKYFIPSNEIKNRIKNKQIKLNGEILVIDDLKNKPIFNSCFWEYDDFIFNWIKTLTPKQTELIFICRNIDDYFGPETTNIKTFNFLQDFLFYN